MGQALKGLGCSPSWRTVPDLLLQRVCGQRHCILSIDQWRTYGHRCDSSRTGDGSYRVLGGREDVRGDLIRIIGNLLKRKDRFDYMVIETTGLADPAPVAQTFFVDDEMKRRLLLDGIVTVVDSKHIWEHLDTSPEAKEQIAFADVILLNKIDLVPANEVDKLEARIRAINVMAKIIRTKDAQVEVDRLLNIGAFDLSRKLDIDPNFLGEDTHQHDPSVFSVAQVENGLDDEVKVNDWFQEVLSTMGTSIYRMKGILNVKGRDHRFVFQGVHMLFDGKADRAWKAGEVRNNQLVFIGKDLDRAALTKGFRSCLV